MAFPDVSLGCALMEFEHKHLPVGQHCAGEDGTGVTSTALTHLNWGTDLGTL